MNELDENEIKIINGAGFAGALIGRTVGRLLTGTDKGARDGAKLGSDIEDALTGNF